MQLAFFPKLLSTKLQNNLIHLTAVLSDCDVTKKNIFQMFYSYFNNSYVQIIILLRRHFQFNLKLGHKEPHSLILRGSLAYLKIYVLPHIRCIFVSARRPRNYSNCCWIFRLIYALSTFATMLPPIFLNILNYHSIYPSIYLSITLHSIYLFLSVNLLINLFHSLNINI